MLAPHRILDVVEPTIVEDQLGVVHKFFQICVLATLELLSHGSQICKTKKKRFLSSCEGNKLLEKGEEGRTHGLFNHFVVVCCVREFHRFTEWPRGRVVLHLRQETVHCAQFRVLRHGLTIPNIITITWHIRSAIGYGLHARR